MELLAKRFFRIISIAVSFCLFLEIGDVNSGPFLTAFNGVMVFASGVRVTVEFVGSFTGIGVLASGEINGFTCVSCCIFAGETKRLCIGVFANGDINGGTLLTSCVFVGVTQSSCAGDAIVSFPTVISNTSSSSVSFLLLVDISSFCVC